jgi:hypothetical protein
MLIYAREAFDSCAILTLRARFFCSENSPLSGTLIFRLASPQHTRGALASRSSQNCCVFWVRVSFRDFSNRPRTLPRSARAFFLSETTWKHEISLTVAYVRTVGITGLGELLRGKIPASDWAVFESYNAVEIRSLSCVRAEPCRAFDIERSTAIESA